MASKTEPPRVLRIFLFLCIVAIILQLIVIESGWSLSSIFHNQIQRSNQIRSNSTKTLADDEKIVDLTNRYISYNDSKPLSLRCKTCSYVTGSGHLKNSKLGKEIDSRECVIRSNDAPTIGYEDDVGIRTTMRIVDVRSLGFIVQKVLFKNVSIDRDFWQELVVMYGNPKRVKNISRFILYVITPNESQRIRKIFEDNVDKMTKGVWISSGFYSLLFLKEICADIHVYGIAYPEYCGEKTRKDVSYHYYENVGTECPIFSRHSRARTNTHRFIKEKKVYREWIKEWGNLHFHSPKWNP